jgi:hypothetical protein
MTFQGQAWVACSTGDLNVYQVSAATIEQGRNCDAFEMEAREDAPFTGQKSTYQYAVSAAPGVCGQL